MILFDIGGVLFCDPWETLVLTPGRGLADRLGVPMDVARAAGVRLWGRYSGEVADESSYWADMGVEVGVTVPPELVREVECELLSPSPWAHELLAQAAATGAEFGIASNNTSFWFAKQSKKLGLSEWINEDLVFVSQELGVAKSEPGEGLFEIAAEQLRGRQVSLVEDRPENLRRAEGLGIRALDYSFERDRDAFPNFLSSRVRL
ncbi:HAD family hydrolase [Streptomyces beijiangensis]|uniref:Uncharacterized protein n=1 Tax=Streptomyces beijiangensis TaxID=163361 RepID=A0A939FBQ8_9ACTN|nr:hypothetical protein [Streptomyces beijiangensis]MBO0516336.1 hypothetical protein [Streptomyces beijiangensis]